jgi:hypothetical protein
VSYKRGLWDSLPAIAQTEYGNDIHYGALSEVSSGTYCCTTGTKHQLQTIADFNSDLCHLVVQSVLNMQPIKPAKHAIICPQTQLKESSSFFTLSG